MKSTCSGSHFADCLAEFAKQYGYINCIPGYINCIERLRLALLQRAPVGSEVYLGLLFFDAEDPTVTTYYSIDSGSEVSDVIE